MTLPPGTNGPNALTVDPQDPKRLYLSAWGVTRPDGDTGGGIFLSTDAGATWRPVFTEAQHVYDVTVDPRDPTVLYACGFDQAAFRSSDRGQTWTRIRGYNFKWGQRVIARPAGRLEDLRDDVRRQRLARPGAGRPERHGGRRPMTLLASIVLLAAASPSASRLEQLVEANILGTHAFQVALAKKDGKGDPACYSAGLAHATRSSPRSRRTRPRC